MQERLSIKKLLACEDEVNDGFAKTTEEFSLQTHTLVECEAGLSSGSRVLSKVKI